MRYDFIFFIVQDAAISQDLDWYSELTFAENQFEFPVYSLYANRSFSIFPIVKGLVVNK